MEAPSSEEHSHRASSSSPDLTDQDNKSLDLGIHEKPIPLTRQATRPDISYAHEYIFVTVVSFSQLFTQIALGMNIAPLQDIGATFGTTDRGQLSWTVAAYSFTVGTFILPAGRIGEQFGFKPVYIAGTVWFALWSLIAGLSSYTHSIIFFDFARAMSGIGPAFMLPSAMAIFGMTYPSGRRKEMIFGLFGSCAPTGYNVGAFFSAVMAQQVSWEWAYYLMAIALVILAVLAAYVIPSVEGLAARKKPGFKIAKLDPWGTLTGVVGLVLFNFAWNQGPVVGWPTSYVYAILIVGCAFLGLFMWIEGRVEYPLVPIKRINSLGYFVLACVASGWASFGVWVYYSWRFLLLLRGQTPLRTAIQFMTWFISGPIASITTGLILGRVRPSIIMLMSMLGFCVGNILMGTQPVQQIFWTQTFFSLVITPWGMDMSFPSASVLLSDFFPRDEQGTAASLTNTVLNYSISIGLGIAGTIEAKVDPQAINLLRGYRCAWYFGIGISAFGTCIAALFVVIEHMRANNNRKELEQGRQKSDDKVEKK